MHWPSGASCRSRAALIWAAVCVRPVRMGRSGQLGAVKRRLPDRQAAHAPADATRATASPAGCVPRTRRRRTRHGPPPESSARASAPARQTLLLAGGWFRLDRYRRHGRRAPGGQGLMTTQTRRDDAPAQAGQPLAKAVALDHANLHVRDVEASLRFYTGTLGLTDHTVLDRDDQGRPSFVRLRVGQQLVFLTAAAGLPGARRRPAARAEPHLPAHRAHRPRAPPGGAARPRDHRPGHPRGPQSAGVLRLRGRPGRPRRRAGAGHAGEVVSWALSPRAAGVRSVFAPNPYPNGERRREETGRRSVASTGCPPPPSGAASPAAPCGASAAATVARGVPRPRRSAGLVRVVGVPLSSVATFAGTP